MSNGYTREMNKLVRVLRRQRWDCRVTGKNHWRLRPPQRHHGIVFAPCTPSDHRSLPNLIAKLRKSGAKI